MLDAALAQNETQARAFWALRENHSEAQKREGPSIKHDISVSVSKIPAFMTEGLAAMKKALPECRPVPFGHVGDGNIHFNCQAPPGWDKARFMAHAEAISGAVYDLVVSHGGSISAEHGIGQLKVDELAHYRSQDRARHHAVDQACARSAEHHEPGQGDPGLVTGAPLA